MSDLGAGPLFVVGAPRSGTSLLRNLIRSCNGIYLPPDETQFLPAYIKRAARGEPVSSLAAFLDSTAFCTNMRKRGIWPSRKELLEILMDPSPLVAISALMRYLAVRERLPAFEIWGDKTPRYIYFLEQFRSVFPRMRVLFVVRDPRDAALSMHEAWGRSLMRGAVAWRDAARIAEEYMDRYGPADAGIVYYEALAAEPATNMARIAQWLGVEFSSSALESYIGEERWGAARGAGVVNTSIGRYRRHLAHADIEIVEGIVFDEMRAWDYVPEQATKSISPSRSRLHLARIGDGGRSMLRYIGERGVREGLGYKLRQFFVARRGRGG
jgi:hypothetical protein